MPKATIRGCHVLTVTPVAEPLYVAQLSSLLIGLITNGQEKRIIVIADVYLAGEKRLFRALIDNGT
jgi:hypothetical protein